MDTNLPYHNNRSLKFIYIKKTYVLRKIDIKIWIDKVFKPILFLLLKSENDMFGLWYIWINTTHCWP